MKDVSNYSEETCVNNKLSIKRFLNVFFVVIFVISFMLSTFVCEAATPKTTKVTISKSSVSVYKGQKYQLKVSKANKKVKHKYVKWSTSNKKIVAVNQKGYIKGVKKGTAYVYCKVTWTNKKSTTVKCKVKVYNPVKLKSYKLSKTSVKLKVGEQVTVKKIINPANATIIKTAIATSNAKVAVINSKGVITAKGAGTTKVCIAIKTYNNKVYKKYVTVNVWVPETSVKLDKTSGSLYVGQSTTLKATTMPSNATYKTVTYKSSDEKVAKVSSSGVLTAVGVGSSSISVTTKNGKTASYKVSVLTPYEIKLDKTTLELKEEVSGNVKATVVRYYGEAKVISYSSSDTKVATVDKDGQVVGVSEGSAIITASVANPTIGVSDKYNKVTCTVKVTKVDKSSLFTKEPYVSTYYFTSRQSYKEDIVIPIYVTDTDQKEYLHDDNTKRFDLLIEVDEKQTYIRDIKAGDMDVNLGRLTKGDHYFALQVIDKKSGLKSHKLYNDLYVIDPEEYVIKESETYYMTEQDMVTYSIDNTNNLDESVCIATKNGLNQLFKDIKELGYRKIVLLKGIYRIDCEDSKYTGVEVPSFFTVDMNESIFKLNTIEEDIGGCLVYMKDTTEAHLTNGTLEGDRFERRDLNLERDGMGEQINTFMFYGCTRSSISNMTVKQTTGHTIYSQYVWGPGTKVKTYTKTNIVDGKEYYCENTSTSNMIDITELKEWSGYVSVGNAEGYRGVKGDSMAVYIHFYNNREEYIETIGTHQYRKVRIPNDAVYARFSMYGNLTLDDNLSFHTKHLGEYLEVTDIDFVDTRTTAIAVSSARHILFENMTYTRSGNSITPCAVDFEDGWQECQDVFYRNNKVIESAGTATVIDNAGYNHIYEGNEGHHYTMRRGLYGGVIQNEVSPSVGTVRWTYGNIVNSKYNRILNVETENIYVWISESDINRGCMDFVVKNCKMQGYIEDTPYKYVTYEGCIFTSFGARRITIKNSIIHPKTYWGTETYIYNSTFVNLENRDEGIECFFNSVNATRYFENCNFVGTTKLKTKNGFNSGTFNKCSFDNLRIEYGMEETVENGGLKFTDCDIKSTAKDFIYAGRYGYTRGLMEISFNNCNLDLGEGNLIFLEGKPLVGSKIIFNKCKFNKTKGSLITGWNVINSSEGQGLEIIFKDTNAEKNLDKSYIEGKDNFIVNYN